MDIRESQSDYGRLGNALRALIKEFDPPNLKKLKPRLEHVIELAGKIGAPLEEDTLALKQLFEYLLKKPKDAQLAVLFRNLALRLEQETREI